MGKEMSKKSRHPNFDQTLELLRAHGFETTPHTESAGGVLVSRSGVGAVLAASGAEVVAVVGAGPLVRGEVARLVDRGYQKFMKTCQFEVPATAEQLHKVHRFSLELKQLTGAESLFNESLGSTSDRYQYDRLKGREAAGAQPESPWQSGTGH
jgi:hypothetical protein